MKRSIILAVYSVLMLVGNFTVANQNASLAGARVAQADQKEEAVYITRTGKKYHRAGCRSLSRSMIPVSRREAQERGFLPCKVCHPD